MTAAKHHSLVAPMEDRRIFQRYKITITALVRPTSQTASEEAASAEISHPAIIQDISITGFHLTSQVLYPIGALLEVEINLNGGEKNAQTHTLTAAVRRAQSEDVQGHVIYQYGVDFVRCPSLDRARRAIADFLSAQQAANWRAPWRTDQPVDLTVPLLAARELEWAEAYVQDHPDCELGQVYLMVTRADLAFAQSDVKRLTKRRR